jgi:hypothetical protein
MTDLKKSSYMCTRLTRASESSYRTIEAVFAFMVKSCKHYNEQAAINRCNFNRPEYCAWPMCPLLRVSENEIPKKRSSEHLYEELVESCERFSRF